MSYARLWLVAGTLCLACGSKFEAGDTGSGGGAPSGGAPSGGGSSGAGASAGAADCATLKADYATALEKARVCAGGSTDECSTSSTLPALGCGCPALVNAKSDLTSVAKQKYQAIQDAKCVAGPICEIACLAYTGAACTAQAASAGTGYVCTGSQSATTN